MQEHLDALLEPLSAAGLRAADAQPGERVLDVGCGCGDTSIALQVRELTCWVWMYQDLCLSRRAGVINRFSIGK